MNTRVLHHRTLVVVFALASTQSVAADVPVTVSLPDYVTWCTPLKLSATEAEVEANHHTARAMAVAKMDKVLLSYKKSTTGIPFFANAKKVTEQDSAGKELQVLTMDACYVVPSDTPAPQDSTIVSAKIKDQRVATLVCARTSDIKCIERLQAAITKETGANRATVDTWQWRYSATLSIPKEPEALIEALTTATARPILGDAQITQYGDFTLPDPKKMRPLLTGSVNVVTVPVEQGDWIIAAAVLP